ncbi:ABC transporter ATP-binding protein [Puniceicoccales bacterium CK1056]|uniref:ABC transporter ATP-binding protein n=1 Tax=Oceanipulchritudo coccoides TaxID=2706888 RepID=A0A6B2LZA4_9BACT|nr:ABC transporter ATP-binding protein [Oceanipulchritudo coccoides]NDV61773.1 ABC transporter ATP-binding protein [Oceanipulchritudo coccoides]
MSIAIELQDLRVDYGDLTAVNNLSLTIDKGEIYGLVGPNGAGKTSTLNVLATLLVPTYGHVRMAGYDLDRDPDAIRARLGYMPDLAPVVGNLRVWEFLDLYAASYGLAGTEKSKRVDECLELVKLADKRDVLCGTLSRGMTQRVVLAKTLLHKPEILLLDEPASGMDPLARIDLKDALQSVATTGATIIISSHILSELAEMATSIGILHKGRLREHGDVHDVLASMEHAISKVEIELVDGREACRDWLASHNLTATLPEKQPHRIHVELAGGKDAQATLLKDLVQANFQIHGFQARRSSLEDVMRAISTEPEESE